MTEIYIADISGIDLDRALERVSPYRREKTVRLRLDVDRRRSLGAELLLHSVFGEDFEYTVGEFGKPLAENVFFSLSHSGDFAVCAVSDGDVGVDIERPRKGSYKLARRFFTPEEADFIEGSDDPDDAFCELWTVKEACLKCDGRGLSALSEPLAFHVAHYAWEGYHIGLASGKPLGEIEIHVKEIV